MQQTEWPNLAVSRAGGQLAALAFRAEGSPTETGKDRLTLAESAMEFHYVDDNVWYIS